MATAKRSSWNGNKVKRRKKYEYFQNYFFFNNKTHFKIENVITINATLSQVANPGSLPPFSPETETLETHKAEFRLTLREQNCFFENIFYTNVKGAKANGGGKYHSSSAIQHSFCILVCQHHICLYQNLYSLTQRRWCTFEFGRKRKENLKTKLN